MSKKVGNPRLSPFHLLIPAAGNASRMGFEIAKPYLKIGGKAILRHTIEKFLRFKELESITVIINEEHVELYNEAVQGIDMCQYTLGSKSRKSSVYNGLNSLSNVNDKDIVLIHDAARPLVQRSDIDSLLLTMKKAEAATLAFPVPDTLSKENEMVDREGIWAIQTPQAFKLGTLKSAHEKFKDDDSFTDDAGLIRALGHEVKFVNSSRQNIKITTQDDLEMAKLMMNNSQYEIRTASGFDVHAFEKKPSDRKLMMGGIEIDYPLALVGHSDADVILHAVTDALLASVNKGDIGVHFPPSDPQWKDADSVVFLKAAIDMLKEDGTQINFIDMTVLAEEPKLSPYREKIQNRIADILDISPTRVSIKATTTEQLGFTGRKEGIACQALATVRIPVTQ